MIIGLDDSGKTSILHRLISSSSAAEKSNRGQQSSGTRQNRPNDQRGASQTHEDQAHEASQPVGLVQTLDSAAGCRGKGVSPTIGYNYERIKYKEQIVNVLDFSGQSKYRGLWQEFFNCVDGIVFVIDSSDLIRLVVVQDELETLLSHPFFATISPSGNLQPTSTENNATSSSINDTSQSAAQVISHQLAQKQVTISQGKLIQSLLTDKPGAQSHSPSAAGRQQTSSDGQPRGLRTRIPILFLANKTDLANSADTKTIVEAINLDQVPRERHPWLIKATSVGTDQGIFEGFDWLLAEILSAS